MGKQNYRPEEIIVKQREIELQCKQGKTVVQAVRNSGISEQTYYRWQSKYGT